MVLGTRTRKDDPRREKATICFGKKQKAIENAAAAAHKESPVKSILIKNPKAPGVQTYI